MCCEERRGYGAAGHSATDPPMVRRGRTQGFNAGASAGDFIPSVGDGNYCCVSCPLCWNSQGWGRSERTAHCTDAHGNE